MTNIEIAQMLRKMAAAYTILGENKFKIIAYENAATAVEHATSELKDLWDDGKLDAVPGLGKSLIDHLDEIFKTGHSKHVDETLKKIDPQVFDLLDVPGVGPKTAIKIVKEGKTKIYLKQRVVIKKRLTLPEANKIADEIIFDLKGFKVDKLGSLRRQTATVGDIDLAIATGKPVNCPKIANVHVDIRVSKPEEYGAMLQYFTGSKYHNIKLREFALKKGYSLSEYGIKSLKSLKVQKFDNEKDFYNFLGLDYIEPELREDSGEIEAALAHKLPKLMELKDIKGDLHLHSNFDLTTSHDSGDNSIEEMCHRAAGLGYEYIAMSNHNPSSKSEAITKLKDQKKYIEQFNYSNRLIRVLNLLEIDIHPNGSLAVPEESLTQLDACLVSIHSSFNMDKAKMTERVLLGLSHSKAKILGHPTGRLLNKREGYELDWEQIFKFCIENNKAVEINCSPDRLDLPDVLVREAVRRGVLLSLGTDAHCTEDLDLMKYGVSVARRGWAENENIINTWDYNRLIKWLK